MKTFLALTALVLALAGCETQRGYDETTTGYYDSAGDFHSGPAPASTAGYYDSEGYFHSGPAPVRTTTAGYYDVAGNFHSGPLPPDRVGYYDREGYFHITRSSETEGAYHVAPAARAGGSRIAQGFGATPYRQTEAERRATEYPAVQPNSEFNRSITNPPNGPYDRNSPPPEYRRPSPGTPTYDENLNRGSGTMDQQRYGPNDFLAPQSAGAGAAAGGAVAGGAAAGSAVAMAPSAGEGSEPMLAAADKKHEKPTTKPAATKPADHKGLVAMAKLTPTEGNKAKGSVHFYKADAGLRVVIHVEGLAPNSTHGIHLHEHADCSAPGATSAGDHWNPTGAPHGGPDSASHHLGDLGNVTADDKGMVHKELTVKDLTVEGDHSVLGHSVILHEKADDLTSQPSGNSGARIACGPIEKPRTATTQPKDRRDKEKAKAKEKTTGHEGHAG